jgi:hypothetical protein
LLHAAQVASAATRRPRPKPNWTPLQAAIESLQGSTANSKRVQRFHAVAVFIAPVSEGRGDKF